MMESVRISMNTNSKFNQTVRKYISIIVRIDKVSMFG